MIDIVETVYRGASKGRGLVVSPKGGSPSRALVAKADPKLIYMLCRRLLDTVQVLDVEKRGRVICCVCIVPIGSLFLSLRGEYNDPDSRLRN